MITLVENGICIYMCVVCTIKNVKMQRVRGVQESFKFQTASIKNKSGRTWIPGAISDGNRCLTYQFTFYFSFIFYLFLLSFSHSLFLMIEGITRMWPITIHPISLSSFVSLTIHCKGIKIVIEPPPYIMHTAPSKLELNYSSLRFYNLFFTIF